jgi:hypothetical protein
MRVAVAGGITTALAARSLEVRIRTLKSVRGRMMYCGHSAIASPKRRRLLSFRALLDGSVITYFWPYFVVFSQNMPPRGS